jgi:hypothetical protein
MKVVTSYWPKPIPVRCYDWTACSDEYDGAPDAGFQPVGYGRTEAEAIANFYEELELANDK